MSITTSPILVSDNLEKHLLLSSNGLLPSRYLLFATRKARVWPPAWHSQRKGASIDQTTGPSSPRNRFCVWRRRGLVSVLSHLLFCLLSQAMDYNMMSMLEVYPGNIFHHFIISISHETRTTTTSSLMKYANCVTLHLDVQAPQHHWTAVFCSIERR